MYEWRWFHNFVQDRTSAVPAGVPWWEGETEKNLLLDIVPLRQMRLLIFGAAGYGKLAMIEQSFGQLVQPGPGVTGSGIATALTVTGNNLIQVHFSDGSWGYSRFLGAYTVANGLTWGATQEVRRGVFDVGRSMFG